MNALSLTQGLGARILAVIALFSLVAGLVPMQAFAAPDSPYGTAPIDKVDICHNNEGKGFVVNNVSISSGGAPQGGHDNDQGAHAIDIIPSYFYIDGDGFTKFYAGKNWTTANEAIWKNGCAAVVVPKSINLSVTKVANDDTPDVAQQVTYTITVSNAGPDTATNVVVTDNIPAGTTFVSAGNGGAGTGPVTWNIASLASGASTPVTLTVAIAADTEGDVITNSASVTATETDSNPANNTTQEDVTVNTPAGPTTGTIVVDKVTNPTLDLQSFVFTTTGTGFAGFSLTDAATPNSQATLAPGAYSVSETAVAGWTQTSVACVSSTNGTEVPGAISLQAGEVVTCTFTNTKNAPGKGTIVVDKVTIPAADAQSFNFTTTGTGYTGFALTDTAMVNTQQLDAGTYSVAETAVAGWTQTSAVCVSSTNGTETPGAISLQAGEVVTCTYTNTKDTLPPPPATCTVTVVSDTANFVVEKNANAQVLSFIHEAWTLALTPAAWIWGDNPVALSTGSETQTFRKQFGFVGAVTGATLEVASDNGHVAALNGTATSTGGSTFNAPVSYNVTSAVAQGNNQLLIAVTNDGAVTDPKTNPAGLKYKLTITGTPTTDSGCSVPYVPPVDVCSNLGGNQATVPEGYTANDGICTENGGGDDDELSCTITADNTTIRRGRDVTLNWTSAGASSVTLTDENGDFKEVSANGSITIENLREDTVFSLVLSNGDNFENCDVSIDTRSGGGGGGGSIGDRDDDDDQDGEVLGDSDDAPEGEVAGDQVSAIPTGAPNAGNGGTSPFAQTFFGIVPVAFARRTKLHG